MRDKQDFLVCCVRFCFFTALIAISVLFLVSLALKVLLFADDADFDSLV